MKKFLKAFAIVVEILDNLYFLLKDFADDGKVNGSARKDV